MPTVHFLGQAFDLAYQEQPLAGPLVILYFPGYERPTNLLDADRHRPAGVARIFVRTGKLCILYQPAPINVGRWGYVASICDKPF